MTTNAAKAADANKDLKDRLAKTSQNPPGDSKQLSKSGKAISNVYDYLKKAENEIARALPKHITPERMSRIAFTTIRSNPKLLECTIESLMGCVMLSAQFGLEPGPLGHCWIIPYNNRKKGIVEAQFQIGYKGYLELVNRSNAVKSFTAMVVCKNDHFEYEEGSEPKLIHRPNFENPGERRLVYAIAHLKDGGWRSVVMTIKEVEAIRARSQSADSGPWVTDYDAMAKKTVAKQLCKWLPLSIEVQQAMTQDEITKDASEILSDTPFIDIEFDTNSATDNDDDSAKTE